MAGYVAVVTDSTACIPQETAYQWGISVVQLQVSIGDQMDDEARVSADTLISGMRGGSDVSTAPPDPAAFFWAYQDAVARGARAVLSLHLSGQLSKTVEHAREAADAVSIPVHVIDTGTIAMSLGYGVLTAARVAQAGADVRQILTVAAPRIQRGTELIHVETLEFLRKGGRIGAASHLLGRALSVKPLLTVHRGRIAPLETSIGSDRAIRKLVDRAVEQAGRGAVDVAVQYFGEDERVSKLVHLLRKRIPRANEITTVEVSAAIAVHVGPGAIGITISPATS
ncbi:MAG TPA: DegV family protein [Pseudonocardiaceae bacterium]|nr:DegV family protein [Pseudonocardiaceae bacterium]